MCVGVNFMCLSLVLQRYIHSFLGSFMDKSFMVSDTDRDDSSFFFFIFFYVYLIASYRCVLFVTLPSEQSHVFAATNA